MGDLWWLWLLPALSVFWAVGAYNRLVRLRAAALVAFAALDARWQQQIGLIEATLAGREPLSPAAEAVRTAAQELSRQWDGLRARPPGLAGLDALARSRDRVVWHWHMLGHAAEGNSGAMQQHWQQGISECEMLSRQFNAAVESYNFALAQFPALLIARVFGFHPAEALPG